MVAHLASPVSTCLQSRDRALAWLLGHLSADGTPAGESPLLTARVPLALAYCGRLDAASCVLARYGDLPPATLIAPPEERYATYSLALLLQGAALLTSYDLVRRLRPELVSRLAPCGAPWSREGVYDEVEIVPACQAGITFLALGDIEAARRIGDLVVDVWRQQPDPNEQLFIITDGEGRLVTDIPVDADELSYRVVRTASLQHFFAGGIASAFLVQLAWATGVSAYLTAADSYLDFAMRQTHQFDTYQVCKTAWGAAYVATATKSPRARSWLVRMAGWFEQTQRPDGSWYDSHYPLGLAGDVALTAEFIQHLTMVAWALGAQAEVP